MQFEAHCFVKEHSGLLRGETQVGLAQFVQLAARPQPGKQQGRVRPRGDYQVRPQVRPRGEVLEEEDQLLVDRMGLDDVVVVEYENRVGVQLGQFIEQVRQDGLDRGSLRGA
jgi:hypothetical protein